MRAYGFGNCRSISKGFVISLLLVALTLTAAVKVQPDSRTYYIQLVRGTDEAAPPAPDSKRVGPKLAETFRAVFRLRSYWEMGRREVALEPGQRAKVSLNKEREVEIDLRRPELRRVSAFQNGALVDRVVRPVGEAMTIIGGSRDGKSVWFIVVRRDKPQPEK
jgi:hypothetical protein